jgi:hypothetical protein
MFECDLRTLRKYLQYIRENEDQYPELIDGWSTTIIDTNFDLNPRDFLKFAESDLKANYDHHLINSLTNIKRAIDCQIDSLFVGFGINTKKSDEADWNFPEKLDVLRKLGLVSPEILNDINRQRNDLEHRYSIPDEKFVKSSIEIAKMFVGYTDKYLYNMPFDGMLREISNPESVLMVTLDYKNRKFLFSAKEFSIKKPTIKVYYDKEICEGNRDEYLKYLIWFLTITDTEYKLFEKKI